MKDGVPVYVDKDGKPIDPVDPEVGKWHPLYLDEGELTFDGFGKLVSPLSANLFLPELPNDGSSGPGNIPPTLNIGFG
jgi:hypothetical protein